jgi:hypothetical protein
MLDTGVANAPTWRLITRRESPSETLIDWGKNYPAKTTNDGADSGFNIFQLRKKREFSTARLRLFLRTALPQF